MAVRDLKLNPTPARARHTSPPTVHAESWFYEEARGLLLVVEHKDDAGNWLGTSQHLIPWAKAKAAMERRFRSTKNPGDDT